VTDDIIHAGIKDVVMHEVGHTLGLRHNFRASAAVSFEQSQDQSYTQVRATGGPSTCP
jgi:predicted Zn-dependent protease